MAFNDWHINHPGKALSIYEIPALAKVAYFESFTGKNITSAFSKPGIWPFNTLAFSDDDFAPCDIYITLDADPQAFTNNVSEVESNATPTSISQRHLTPPRTDHIETARIVQPEPTPSTSKATPESVRPFPKCTKTAIKRKGKEKGSSRNYTDTPEKERLQELANIKEQKRLSKQQRQRAKELNSTQLESC